MKKIIFNVYAALLASVSIFCVILMTEPGQSLNVPREWLLGYYRNAPIYMAMQAVALIGLWVLSEKWGMWNRKWMSLASLGVVFALWASMHAMPTAFPTEQFTAEFLSAEEADQFIPTEDQRVYVVELNGEVRIFPRHHVQIPHVAGWQSQETNYAMTYCGLSNLPMVIETDYGLGEADLQVLGQSHNNLIFKDINNRTAIQQITMQSEFTDHSTTVHPNTMMEWSVAKELYPDAQVYIYPMDRFIDELLLDVFEGPLEMQRTKGERFIFPTLDLVDDRMEFKTEIFGYDNGKAQIAIDPDFARGNNGYQFELAGEPLQIQTDGEVVRLVNMNSGKQVPTHNGVHFGIWSQFFGNSEVLQ